MEDQELRELCYEFFNYIPETGDLVHKTRDVKWFKSEHSQKVWNTKNAGKIAGYKKKNTKSHTPYIAVKILGRPYLAHRLIWFILKGQWPDTIDHVDHDGLNNRIENLRDVSIQENGKNKPLLKSNKSGAPGVFWSKIHQKWRVQIAKAGKTYHIGLFENLEDAKLARKRSEIEHNFHSNHGKPL